jgi:NTE family protein
MQVFIYLLLFLCFQLISPVAQATDDQADAPSPKRPKIALVLSGGGARGYSHIGVLEVLEQLHIPVDMIVGTSMGAVVGGLYSTGLSAEALEKKVSSVDLGDVAFDRVLRQDLPQTKREDQITYPISIPAGFDDSGNIKFPRGFVSANSFLALLQEWTGSVPPNRSFDALPIPFRAVATDLESGERVVFDHGSLPIAIRASMAAPGLFLPIDFNGRTLIDGGIVDNLPVDVARELGADVVIAVHIGTPLRKRTDIKSPADVAQQMVGILIGQNVKAQKESLTSRDVLISPDLGNIAFTDFTRAAEAIEDGRQAAQALSKQLSAYAVSPEEYATYAAAHRVVNARGRTRIDEIDVNSVGHVSKAYVERYLQAEAGDDYDAHAINERLARLEATGYFQQVSHDFVEEDGVNKLRVNAVERKWGPNFLLFGVGLSTDFAGGGGFQINIGHRRPWITSSGLEWRNDLSLGDNMQSFHTELRQPLFNRLSYYLSPYAEVSQRIVNYYSASNGYDTVGQSNRPLMTMSRVEGRTGLDFAMPLAHLGELRLGGGVSHIGERPNQDVLVVNEHGDIASVPVPTQTWTHEFARVKLVIDQLDNALFPRSGYRISADAESSFGGDSSDAYRYLHASVTGAASLGRSSVNATLEAGVAKDSGAPFSLGGFRRLAAYGVDEFSGNYLSYGQITYQFQIASPKTQAVRDLYLGATAEAGSVSVNQVTWQISQLKKSLSVFVGATTAFGPAYIGYAFAPGGTQSVYLQFGASF